MKKEARFKLNAKSQKTAIFATAKISKIFKTDFQHIILQQLNSMSAQNAPNTVTLSLRFWYTLIVHQVPLIQRA